MCPIPTVNENNQPVYAMVSPVGYHAVDMIEQAPRLDTLEGKKIALVGGSFMAAVTHAELKRCILEMRLGLCTTKESGSCRAAGPLPLRSAFRKTGMP